MSCRSSNSTRRSRNPSCTLCCNHGVRAELKGHKFHCPFNECVCKLCDRGRERREVMRKQVKLRRQQMKHIYAKEYAGKKQGVDNSKIDTPQKIAQAFKSTYEPQTGSGTYKGLANSKGKSFSPTSSINHQSSQTTTENNAPYYGYSKFPTYVNPFPQNNEAFAYYLSLSPPGISTPPEDHSPRQHSSPLVGGLSASENSAFVRFSPKNHQLREARMGASCWPTDVKDSKEAALALASLQHNKI